MSPDSSAVANEEEEEKTFDHALLRSYMRTLMEASLSNITTFEKPAIKKINQQLSSRIKDRMIDLGPKHWKYIVQITTNANLGQGGRADMANHWGPKDAVIQEIYSNQSIICVCFAYIITLPVPAQREIVVPFSPPPSTATSKSSTSNYFTPPPTTTTASRSSNQILALPPPRPAVNVRNSSLPRGTGALSSTTASQPETRDASHPPPSQ